MKKAVFVYKCKMCGRMFYEDAHGLAFDMETDELMVLEGFETPLTDKTHLWCSRTTYEFTPIIGKAEYVGIGWVEEKEE